jgi:hypothetical protein
MLALALRSLAGAVPAKPVFTARFNNHAFEGDLLYPT